jgi:hypothetical protein
MNAPAPHPSAAEAQAHRRKPALWGVALLLGCLAMFAWQTMLLFDLRREQTSLRAAAATLDSVRQENTELQRLRAVAESAQADQKELLEVEKLRAEVEQLQAASRDLPALRTENQRLLAERATAAASAGVVTEVDPFAEAKNRAQRINCISNIKQICLAARLWEKAHPDVHALPGNFLVMSNELNTPKILTCAGDTTRTKANSWQEFDGSSVSYELLSPGVDIQDPSVVYVRCLIHFNVGLVDGSAQQLDPANHRIEKVDGKFKMITLGAQQ